MNNGQCPKNGYEPEWFLHMVTGQCEEIRSACYCALSVSRRNCTWKHSFFFRIRSLINSQASHASFGHRSEYNKVGLVQLAQVLLCCAKEFHCGPRQHVQLAPHPAAYLLSSSSQRSVTESVAEYKNLKNSFFLHVVLPRLQSRK